MVGRAFSLSVSLWSRPCGASVARLLRETRGTNPGDNILRQSGGQVSLSARRETLGTGPYKDALGSQTFRKISDFEGTEWNSSCFRRSRRRISRAFLGARPDRKYWSLDISIAQGLRQTWRGAPMSLDLIIRNGTVIDGTGEPRYRADVAIAQGRIVAVGKVSDGADRVIDGSDLIVAPGFIDPHTHYDAQICWDPLITCSSWHGVTSVVMGNCGVGIAPCKRKFRETATWDLVNVEGIPFDVLAKGIRWEWESFPQFMDAAARRGSALNLGFFAPLTPFRHYVMGEDSIHRAARREETAQIKQLIKEAVAAGAVGFSTTNVRQHLGYRNLPIACRQASREEFAAYANALRELGKGTIEIQL